MAGGMEKKKDLSTVEVMDTEILQWSTASSLPHPLSQGSATLCGDKIYILAGFSNNFNGTCSKSVFSCSLPALLLSCQQQSLIARLKSFSLAPGSKAWHQLVDTPFAHSPCASLHGQLLIVGGRDSNDESKTAIHTYNTTTNSWEVISHMATPRHQSLVAVLPHNEIMVVGSYTLDRIGIDSVEIATTV